MQKLRFCLILKIDARNNKTLTSTDTVKAGIVYVTFTSLEDYIKRIQPSGACVRPLFSLLSAFSIF